MGRVDALSGVYDTPVPPLSTQLLIVFGVIGVCAWIVSDVGMGSDRSTTTKVAHGAMVVVFGACIVAGALLS